MKDNSMFVTRPNTSRESDAHFSDQMKEVFELINGPILDEWLRIYPVLQSQTIVTFMSRIIKCRRHIHLLIITINTQNIVIN